jgi:hypothetical protein
MFNHHIPPSFLEGLGTRTTKTVMNKYIRKMYVAYDTDAFCVIWNVSHKFRNKKEFFMSLEQFEYVHTLASSTDL